MTPDTLVPFAEAMARYEPVIGLETHVELGTRTKMFCGCGTAFGAEPNSQVCPVCLGLPGSLPVVNRMAIEYAIRIGLALNCSIAPWGRFARKNYFYPDMPKNFQISQYDEPLCVNGWLDVLVTEEDGQHRTVRVEIERVHLEEDTGKSLHVGGATGRIHGADYSLVDYNRAGIPLVEIVTKTIEGTGADAPAVARVYVTELRNLLRALGVSDVRMEEGSLRCDVNTSLSPRGSGRWGTRTETKNVNSLRSVERAVWFEIERQAAVLDDGGRIIQETRHFHEDTGTTTSGRSKEEAQDYRYFPEPDLVPVAPSADWVEQIRAGLPEVPTARQARLQAEWGLSEADMTALRNADALDLVADTVAAGASPADARKWWLGELARRANEAGKELSALAIAPARVTQIAEQVRLALAPGQMAQTAELISLAHAITPAQMAQIAEQVRLALAPGQMAQTAELISLAHAITPAQMAQIAEQVGLALAAAEKVGIAEQVGSADVITPEQMAKIAERVRMAPAITPAQVAQIAELVSAGTLNDRLARQVIDGALAGEGSPDEVVANRGLAVVSDEDALTRAIDEAIAANPDVVAKIRDGKVAATGVLLGAVMKATRGQADAPRVRELILQRLA